MHRRTPAQCSPESTFVSCFCYNRVQTDGPPNQKLLLRRWLAFVKLANAAGAAETLAQLEAIPLDDNTQETVDALKDRFATEAKREGELSALTV